MDKIVAVGEKVGDLEERTLMFMKAVRSPPDLLRMAMRITPNSKVGTLPTAQTANDMGADFQALTWKKALCRSRFKYRISWSAGRGPCRDPAWLHCLSLMSLASVDQNLCQQ